jgi:hypothetical protein
MDTTAVWTQFNTSVFGEFLIVMTPNMACMDNVIFGVQPQSDFINVDSMGILNIDVSQERVNQEF